MEMSGGDSGEFIVGELIGRNSFGDSPDDGAPDLLGGQIEAFDVMFCSPEWIVSRSRVRPPS
jgi:hypothetical protein